MIVFPSLVGRELLILFMHLMSLQLWGLFSIELFAYLSLLDEHVLKSKANHFLFLLDSSLSSGTSKVVSCLHKLN